MSSGRRAYPLWIALFGWLLAALAFLTAGASNAWAMPTSTTSTHTYDTASNSSSATLLPSINITAASRLSEASSAGSASEVSAARARFVAAEEGTAAIRWAGRDPNYRSNLTKALGKPPAGDYDAHHVLPVEFGQDFARVGLDANAPQYGTWVPRIEHQGFSSEYAKDWGAFLRGSPSQSQVLDFARMMGGKYGFDVHF